MTVKELTKEQEKAVLKVITPKERGGATVDLSEFFKSKAGQGLLSREKIRSGALKSA
jgi:hypothetical protein